jgi:ubiquinone/menaquinone biosynthesis C-methylase UbiE
MSRVIMQGVPEVDQIAELQRALDDLLRGRRGLRILEAGCGSRTNVRLPASSYITGIDISEEQLQRNSGVDEKIVGDIQSFDLPDSSYDVVICWEVLEHVPEVSRALLNLFRSTKPGGFVILALPNVYSLKGMITKMTPYSLHTWFYTQFLKDPKIKPFPTYLRLSASPRSIARLAGACGFSVEYLSSYESPWQRTIREKYGITGYRWEAMKWLVNRLSFWRIKADLTDFILVLRKQCVERTCPGIMPMGGVAQEANSSSAELS